MRIVAGRWRGRQLVVPEGRLVRPTADRVREAWMNVVQLHLPDALVLDLFAGSGALGLEALSRGAARVEFVESHPRALRALQRNVETFDAAASVDIHRADVLPFLGTLRGRAFDVAFADPPYHGGTAAAVADRWLRDPFAGLLGIEHESVATMPAGGASRRYGPTSITLYRLGDS